MSTIQATCLAALVGLGPIACSLPPGSNRPTELKLENLLQMTLDDQFVPGREVVVSYVEVPPNTTMERHWHPGEEFQYYLEGEVEIEIDGAPAITGKPGMVGHVPFKKMHTARTGEHGARLVVFRVHTKGEPVRYLVSGGSSEQ